jgi:hypothetical protein
MRKAATPGTTLKIVGLGLLVLCAVATLSSKLLVEAAKRLTPDSTLWDFVPILSVLAIILFPSGIFLYWRGKQYAAQASAKSILADAKPHLLYLRPFRSDDTVVKKIFSPTRSEEEQLAGLLRPFGELVAIGRPSESLPPPGAARIYASYEEWKDVVKRQMQIAALELIRAAVGENVLWELMQAVNTLEPQKLLILILRMKTKDYESFRMKAAPILGPWASLPERAAPWRFGRVSGFISFSANWKPTFLAFTAPDYIDTLKSRAHDALRPVFENFGLEWQPESNPRPRTSAFFFFLIAVLVWVLIII